MKEHCPPMTEKDNICELCGHKIVPTTGPWLRFHNHYYHKSCWEERSKE
jgi:hypothetical protein